MGSQQNDAINQRMNTCVVQCGNESSINLDSIRVVKTIVIGPSEYVLHADDGNIYLRTPHGLYQTKLIASADELAHLTIQGDELKEGNDVKIS